MKIVDLKCPNCSGKLRKEDDMFVCESCGAAFAVDYDESDVEYERLQGEAKRYELQRRAQMESERRQRQKKRTDNLRATVTGFVILGTVVFIIASVIVFMFKFKQNMEAGGVYSGSVAATPTPAPNYDITPDDVADSMSDFIEAGKIAQMNITECATRNENGLVKNFHKTDAVFLEAYIVSDIPDVRESQSVRLVLIYQVTWHNDELGDHTCYDGVYFEGIRINPNGGIISDFNPRTIWRSDAAWGWAMAYSFEDHDQCYRENVSSLGGVVTPVTVEGDA